MNKSLLKNKPLDDYCLDNKRVDIWQIPLQQLPDWADALLNEEEKTRAQRFYFERHRRRFTVARAMLRVILGRYLNQSPAALQFAYNAHGKPQISHNSTLTFNLSHSQDMALLAVGCDYPLGIDIEYFSTRPFLGIAQQLFSTQEIAGLAAAHTTMQPLVFFNIWAQKEAFIKASGLGLAYPTQEFEVAILPTSPTIIADNLHHQSWQMLCFMPQIAASAALCCNPAIERFYYHILHELNRTL